MTRSRAGFGHQRPEKSDGSGAAKEHWLNFSPWGYVGRCGILRMSETGCVELTVSSAVLATEGRAVSRRLGVST
jgi:hypothetical protein